MRNKTLMLAAVGALVAGLGWGTPAAQAAMAYEPLALGSAGLTHLSGQAPSGYGFTGQFACYGMGSSDYISYDPSGLSLGSLAVSGGSAKLASNMGAAGISVQFATDFSGTVSGSYLFRSNATLGNASSNNSRIVTLQGKGARDNFNYPGIATKYYHMANGAVQINNYNNATEAAGTPLAAETTYLVLFQYELADTDPVATGNQQRMTMWILDGDQFANFKSGGLTAALLNGAGTGSAANDVTQRATLTATSNAGLDHTGYLNISTTGGVNGDNYWDEFRLADGADGLNAVTPVPEPASVALVGLGGLMLLAKRRKHTHV